MAKPEKMFYVLIPARAVLPRVIECDGFEMQDLRFHVRRVVQYLYVISITGGPSELPSDRCFKYSTIMFQRDRLKNAREEKNGRPGNLRAI